VNRSAALRSDQNNTVQADEIVSAVALGLDSDSKTRPRPLASHAERLDGDLPAEVLDRVPPAGAHHPIVTRRQYQTRGIGSG